MRVLIDTHILLWWLANDSALPPTFRQLIVDPENTIYLSAVNLWEIWLKQSAGKLKLPDGFPELVEQENFETLPLTGQQVARVDSLPWRHRDPFDRMLVAQAQVERLTLLTADEQLAAYGGLRTIREITISRIYTFYTFIPLHKKYF